MTGKDIHLWEKNFNVFRNEYRKFEFAFQIVRDIENIIWIVASTAVL